jgi:hypothetical protein
MGEHDTIQNALIGAAVGIFTSFIPFSTVLGGAVAGYLQGGTSSDGVRVGAIAGGIQMLLTFVMGGLFVLFFSALVAGTGDGAVFGITFFFLFLVVIVITAIYTVVLSALGGWLGNYVKYETDIGN